MDVLFQSVWFRLIYLLLLAMYITVFWFVLGPASKVAEATTPWYAVSVACGTFGLVLTVPAPAVMRRVPRQSASLRASASSIACFALACSAGCLMSPDGIAMSSNRCGDSPAKGPAFERFV